MTYRATLMTTLSGLALAVGLQSGQASAQAAGSPPSSPSAEAPIAANTKPNAPEGTAQAPGDSFESIVVTARKRPEVAQTVPIAISAFDQAALTRLNVNTLQDLQSVAPSVFIQPSTFRQDTINITIRGQQNFQSTDLSFDTATAVYVDGVYYARPVGLTGALFDVNIVEVLKGPQGTLVGRNSTGGAVLYQTREPNSKFGGYLTVTGGDYDHDDVQGAINLPLTNNLWFRAAFAQSNQRGYLANDFSDPTSGYTNTTPAEGFRKDAGIFSLRWQPDDTFHVTLRGSFDVEHDTGTSYHDLGYFVGTTLATGNKPSICNIPGTCSGFTDLLGHVITPYYTNYLTGTAVSTLPSAYNSLLSSVARAQTEGFWSIEQAAPNYDVGHFQVVSGVVDKMFGNIDVRLTAAYRWFDTTGASISRGLPYDTNIFIYDTPDYKSYQSELTVNGSEFDNRLKWTSGLFYFRETSPDDGDQNYLFLPSGVTPTAATGKQITYTNPTTNGQENTSYAGYLQSTFSVRPDTRITAGVRFTEDDREAQLLTQSVRFPASPATTATIANGVYSANSVVLNGITYAGQTDACTLTDATGKLLPLANCNYNLEKTYHKPTWMVSVDHDLFDKTLVYVTTRSGYRSGGINAAAIIPGAFIAAPENIQDYEIGVKSDWKLFGIPVRANVDAYYSDYTDIQIQTSLPNVTLAGTSTGGICTQAAFNAGQCVGTSNDNVTLNAKSAHISGYEWDVTVRPFRGLTLSSSGSYIHAIYTNYSFSPPPGYLLPVGTTNFSGTHFPLPAWQINTTATYSIPIHKVLNVDFDDARFSWHMYWQSNNEASLVGYNQSELMKGYSMSNARFDVLNIEKKGIDFGAYVTNVFNKEACIPESQGVLNSAPNATYGVAGTSGVLQCIPAPPRMYGLRLAYSF